MAEQKRTIVEVVEIPVPFELTYPADISTDMLERIKQRAAREVHLDLWSGGNPSYSIKTVRVAR